MSRLRISEDGGLMMCRNCRSEYVSVIRVDSFRRHAEDSGQGLHTMASFKGAPLVVDTNTSANPSARRDGVIVFLDCENCGCTSKITFANHKGLTLVDYAL